MEEYIFNYNYIILGSDGYYLAGYKDIMNLPNVKYYTDYYSGFTGRLSRHIVRLNFSKEVNRYIHTPFRHFVYPKLFPNNFGNDKPICYLIFGGWHFVYNSTYLEYLKKKNKSTKCVLYLQDLVCRNKYLSIEHVKSRMDMLLSYDQGDCDKYGMLFYPTPMSKSPFEEKIKNKTTDFYFCGKAKGRYKVVHRLYKLLTSRGFQCDFNILEMPVNEEHLSGINYISTPLNYQDNIERVKNTRCVVEIMQEGADGFTPRLWESIMSDTHLLSNNSVIRQSRYFIPENIHVIDDNIEGMDFSWINNKAIYNNDLKDALSPVNLLKFIDKQL